MKKSLLLRGDQRMYRQLMHDQYLEPGAILRLQNERAIAQARFAMEHTRFYRDRYTAAGFTLKDLEDPAAFAELPIVEKSDVREQSEYFRSTEATTRNSKMSVTGGSTGEPLHILRDLRTPTRTLEWRLFDWWGVDPSDNVALISRQVRDPKQEALHNLQWWPSKRIQLDAYRMDSARIDTFVRRWERTRPAVLVGYVGGIAELARILRLRGFTPTAPRAVAVTAAPVTPAQRAAIEGVFHAPVYDHYRSSEIPWIAGECVERNGLHTFADMRKIEILDSSNQPVAVGEVGEVVATDMTNRVFPLVRYRLGDKSSPIAGECACGVTLPRIQSVTGRVSDAMHLPDGQIVAGESLTQTFSNAPHAVLQFQVHQETDYSIVVRCVRGNAVDADKSIDIAVEKVRDIVMRKVPVRLEIVENIPHDGGKVRYITSDIH